MTGLRWSNFRKWKTGFAVPNHHFPLCVDPGRGRGGKSVGDFWVGRSEGKVSLIMES